MEECLHKKKEFIKKLNEIKAIKFGKFTLKSGLISPFYIDLRNLVSYPDLMDLISDLLIKKLKDLEFDVITGIPYTALPFASVVAQKINKPLIYKRKENKAYGTKKNVIGNFKKGDRCLVIDDLITTGQSKLETAEAFEKEGLVVEDFAVIVDRSAQGEKILNQRGYKLHSLISLDEILDVLSNNELLSAEKKAEVINFTQNMSEKRTSAKKIIKNALTIKLQNKIKEKKSNLILSLDVDNQTDFFDILEQTANSIVMLKTHVDIIKDFDNNFIKKLKFFKDKYNFLILEDRKFADIGNTVRMQYRKGIYKISEWADFVTVHLVPGAGILDGLFGDLKQLKSSFVLARMSSKGNLIDEAYSRKCFEIVRNKNKHVSGFIGHGKSINDIKRFKEKFSAGMLLLMPGVKLEKGKDKLGQQYLTVETALKGRADGIIVGRGIYQQKNPGLAAEKYRKTGWAIYQNLIKDNL